MHIMKKQIKITVYFLFCLTYSGMVYGQGVLPLKKWVKGMPRSLERPSAAASMSSNNSSRHPWIVFSDRVGNFTTASRKSSAPLHELAWMEPLFVLKERSGYLKVAKYDPNLLKGRLIRSSKKLTEYGWIAKSNLLLSQASFVNKDNGFPEKTITLVNGQQPASDPARYFDADDSVYVFNSPALTEPVGKIRLYELTYRYKTTPDGNSVLIGNKHRILPDSAGNAIDGWISAKILQTWGDRVYLTRRRFPSPGILELPMYGGGAGQHSDPSVRRKDIPLKGFPVVNTRKDSLTVQVANDLFHKENNSVITIGGSNLKYPTYLQLREHLPKMNVVWVLDAGSAMKKYFAGLANIIQSLETEFKQYSGRHSLNYGAVVYRDDQNCAFPGLSSMDTLTPDYRDLMQFLKAEAEKTLSCSNDVKSVPLYDGVRRALDLFKDRKNESNLIVVVGSVGDSSSHIRQLPAQIGTHNARILTVQMYSDYNEWYNNFVLNAKKLVTESAIVVAEEKKKYLIDGEGLNERQLYNTSQLDSISYYLDYPENSLVQGGVVFPTKGEVISKKQLSAAVRRLLKETDDDISKQLRSLDSAFRLSGIAHENVSIRFFEHFGGEDKDAVGDRMPHNGFKFPESFHVPISTLADSLGDVQYMLILNQFEYNEMLAKLQSLSGYAMEVDRSSYRRILYKKYKKMLLALQPERSKRTIRTLPLGEYFKELTGLPLPGNEWMKYRVVDIRNGMSTEEFQSYRHFMNALLARFQTQGMHQRFFFKEHAYYFITEEDLTGKSVEQ